MAECGKQGLLGHPGDLDLGGRLRRPPDGWLLKEVGGPNEAWDFVVTAGLAGRSLRSPSVIVDDVLAGNAGRKGEFQGTAIPCAASLLRRTVQDKVRPYTTSSTTSAPINKLGVGMPTPLPPAKRSAQRLSIRHLFEFRVGFAEWSK